MSESSSGGKLIYFRHARLFNITIINYKYVGKSKNVQIIFLTTRLRQLAGHIKHTKESAEVFQSAENDQRRSLQISHVAIERWKVNRITRLYCRSTRPEPTWKRCNGYRPDCKRIAACPIPYFIRFSSLTPSRYSLACWPTSSSSA